MIRAQCSNCGRDAAISYLREGKLLLCKKCRDFRICPAPVACSSNHPQTGPSDPFEVMETLPVVKGERAARRARRKTAGTLILGMMLGCMISLGVVVAWANYDRPMGKIVDVRRMKSAPLIRTLAEQVPRRLVAPVAAPVQKDGVVPASVTAFEPLTLATSKDIQEVDSRTNTGAE